MKKHLAPLAVGLLLACPAVCAWADDPASQPVSAAPFDAERYLAHVKYLASDECEGRLPGTPGIELAAEYIAKQFAEAGLKPAGDDGTWFQSFEVRHGKKLVDADAVLKLVEGKHTWEVRKDWIPLPFTGTEDVQGPLAFAGYGIKAGAYDYDDYAGFDAKGKVLLMFRYEPAAEDPNADFGGKTPSRHSVFARKAEVAARQEALALLIVNPPKREGLDDTLYPFDAEFTEQTFDLPIVHVTREVAEALLKKAGLPDLATLQEKLDRERKPLSADMNVQIELKTGVKPNLITTRNVIGLLKGDGSTEDTLVLGAHYDHLGKVPQQFDRKDNTPQIHNGADDNASGTAGVIELARILGHERGLRRSLLFIAFSAEELGLLGSEHFVDHPTIDLKSIRAMFNFDMIGRLSADKFTVFGINTGKEFGDMVSRAAEQVGLKYRAAKGVPANSDHDSFSKHDIPVLFGFTGVHKEYHRPTDKWPLIDAPGATKVLALFRIVVRDAANMEEGPTFQATTAEPEPEDDEMKPGIEHEKEAQEAGEKGSKPKGNGEVERPTRPAARLGIIPDFTGSDEPGVVADTILDGGAAKEAGMQSGDRIIRLNEQKIKDIYGYMSALKEFKPGDTLEVVVVRKGEEVTLKVTVKGPPKRPGRE